MRFRDVVSLKRPERYLNNVYLSVGANYGTALGFQKLG